MTIDTCSYRLHVYLEIVHLVVVDFAELLLSLLLSHGGRPPLVDEDLGVVGMLLAESPVLLSLGLQALVVLDLARNLDRALGLLGAHLLVLPARNRKKNRFIFLILT